MERVFEIIEEQLHLSGMELSEDLSLKDDLGADSIDLVELVMALEDESVVGRTSSNRFVSSRQSVIFRFPKAS
mgnify:CR=1 FL=1